MHITGRVVVDKKTATVDAFGTCDGSNGRTTMTVENRNVEITAVAGTYYVKANAAYWLAAGMPQATIVTIGTRYLATTDPSLGSSSVSSLVGSLKTSQAVTDGMGVIAERTTLTGRPVYLFSVTTKDGRMTIWVTDTAYTLLRVRLESPSGTEELTFSDWNSSVSYTAPPEAQVIRL
jgi:outer membrane lipoprotein-sorting protein